MEKDLDLDKEPIFHEGDKVSKLTGYAYDGTVRSVFRNGLGQVRLVVEHDVSKGMLHIFNQKQVKLRKECSSFDVV